MRSHPFFASVNWNWIDKRLVKPPIQPEIGAPEKLSFWENAQQELVTDEEEMAEMRAAGQAAEVPGPEGLAALYAWV